MYDKNSGYWLMNFDIEFYLSWIEKSWESQWIQAFDELLLSKDLFVAKKNFDCSEKKNKNAGEELRFD